MTQTSERNTGWPRLAASAAIFRDGKILLGERGKGAMVGLWSLPGGHVEPGEAAREAARREVREETGIEARILGLVDLHEVIQHQPTSVSAGPGLVAVHYVIAVHFGLWLAGEPSPADDCRATGFFDLDNIGGLAMTDGARGLIEKAAALVQGHR